MNQIDLIKEKIKEIYESGHEIRVTIRQAHHKPKVEDARALIRGVYPHIFRIVLLDGGKGELHTVLYTDVVSQGVIISGLNKE